MGKKLAVLVGMLLFALVVGPAPVADAAPDPYEPKAPTECVVRVPAKIKEGNRPTVQVRVEANSQAKPTGTVTVRLFGETSGIALAKAGEIWSTTRHFDGTPLTIKGPVLDQVGKYRLTSLFEPDNSSDFKKCRGSAEFEVEVKSATDRRDDDDGDQGASGLLPNTGGPYLWLLLLGLGLVGGGTVVVVYGRRRDPAVPTA